MNPYLQFRRLCLQLLLCMSVGASTARADAEWLRHLHLQGEVELLKMPDERGHFAFVEAIQAARSNIFMMMYRLTDKGVVSALIQAAQRGVDVKIILDGKGLRGGESRAVFYRLLDNGVKVRSASRAFTITHAKTMVIDDASAFVTSINLTNSAFRSRDFGVVTTDRGVIAELRQVFFEDWRNSLYDGDWTPQLRDPHLIWSPVDARMKLADLIDSAMNSIDAMSQNISDPVIMKALARAAGRGVRVRLLVPFCDKGTNHFFNVPYVRTLVRRDVDARLMPFPSTPSRPYIHAKAMVVDASKAYVGSINFSSNSTMYARELGIVMDNRAAIEEIQAAFRSDWSQAVGVPDRLPATCTP